MGTLVTPVMQNSITALQGGSKGIISEVCPSMEETRDEDVYNRSLTDLSVSVVGLELLGRLTVCFSAVKGE